MVNHRLSGHFISRNIAIPCSWLGKPSQKNGETWGKVQTLFTPSLPPPTWESLTVIKWRDSTILKSFLASHLKNLWAFEDSASFSLMTPIGAILLISSLATVVTMFISLGVSLNIEWQKRAESDLMYSRKINQRHD